MMFQSFSIFFAPSGDAVQLPATLPSVSAAGNNDSVFYLLQPFIRLFVRPDTVITGTFKLRRKDCSVIHNLITVQDHGIFYMIPRYIQRRNVVAGIIIRIFNNCHTRIFLFQRVKLFFQITNHNINFRDPILMKTLNHCIDHPLTVDFHQWFRCGQCDWPHPVAQTGSHNNCPFCFIHDFLLL